MKPIVPPVFHVEHRHLCLRRYTRSSDPKVVFRGRVVGKSVDRVLT